MGDPARLIGGGQGDDAAGPATVAGVGGGDGRGGSAEAGAGVLGHEVSFRFRDVGGLPW